METIKERYKKICRACMKTESAMKKIFNSEINSVPISQMLSFATPINVRPDDGLPSSICYYCLNRLIGAYKFQQMCIDSDLEMRTALRKSNELSSPDILESLKSSVTEGIPLDSDDDYDYDNGSDICDVTPPKPTINDIHKQKSLIETTTAGISSKIQTIKNHEYKHDNSSNTNEINMNIEEKQMNDEPIDVLQTMVLKCEVEDDTNYENNTIPTIENNINTNQTNDNNTIVTNEINTTNDDEEEILFTIETNSIKDCCNSYQTNSNELEIPKLRTEPKPKTIQPSTSLSLASLTTSAFSNSDSQSVPKISFATSLAPQAQNQQMDENPLSNFLKNLNKTIVINRSQKDDKLKKSIQQMTIENNPMLKTQAVDNGIKRINKTGNNSNNKNNSEIINEKVINPLNVNKKTTINNDAEKNKSNNVIIKKKNDMKVTLCGYICDFCKFVFENGSELTEHIKSSCPKITYQINNSQQQKKLPTLNNSKNVTTPCIYKCGICFKYFNQKKNLEEHLLTEHKPKTNVQQNSNANEKFVIQQVDSSSHVKFKPKFVCNFCKEDFDNWKGLSDHLSDKHKLLQSKKSSQFYCQTCNISLHNWKEFEQHLSEHKTISVHSCNLCKEIFNNYDDLTKHLNEHKIKISYGTDTGRNPSVNVSLTSVIKPAIQNVLHCKRCKSGFKTHDEVISHLAEHEQGYSNSMKIKKVNTVVNNDKTKHQQQQQQQRQQQQQEQRQKLRMIFASDRENNDQSQQSTSKTIPRTVNQRRETITKNVNPIEILDESGSDCSDVEEITNIVDNDKINISDDDDINELQPLSSLNKSQINKRSSVNNSIEISNIPTTSKSFSTIYEKEYTVITHTDNKNENSTDFLDSNQYYKHNNNRQSQEFCLKDILEVNIKENHDTLNDAIESDCEVMETSEPQTILLPEAQSGSFVNYPDDLLVPLGESTTYGTENMIDFENVSDYEQDPIDVSELENSTIMSTQDDYNEDIETDYNEITDIDYNSTNKSGKLQCDKCEMKLSSSATLIRHKQRWHSDKPPHFKFMCQVCCKPFNREEKFKLHLKTHKNTENNLSTNLKIENQKSTASNLENSNVSDKMIFSCKYCDDNFNNRSSFRRHIRTTHNEHFKEFLIEQIDNKTREINEDNAQNFDCNICSREFDGRYNLLQHMKKHRSLLEEDIKDSIEVNKNKTEEEKVNITDVKPPIIKQIRCELCNKLFAKESLKYHIMSVHSSRFEKKSLSEISNVCPICDSNLPNKDMLRRHMRVVHVAKGDITKNNLIMDNIDEQGIQFKCDICSNIFRSFMSLSRHNKLNHENKEIKEDKDNVKQWFQCETCNKKFNIKSKYELHTKTHENEQKQTNTTTNTTQKDEDDDEDQTSNISITPANERWEKILHFSKPHRCLYCRLVYPNRQAFSRHMNKTHREFVEKKKTKFKDKQCHICTKTLSKKCKLKYHILRHIPSDAIGKKSKLSKQNELPEKNITVSVDNENSNELPFCKICKRHFSTKQNTIRHVMMVHHKIKSVAPSFVGLKRSVKCKYCPKVFYTTKNFIIHLRMHDSENSKNDTTDDNKVIKESATKITASIYNSRRIISKTISKSDDDSISKSKKPNTNNVCRICGNIFFREQDVKRHLIMKHRKLILEEKRQQNNLKDKKGSIKKKEEKKITSSLPRMKRIKTLINDDNRFCKICGKKYSRPEYIERHQIVHIRGYKQPGNCKIRCKICNKYLLEDSTLYHFEVYHLFKDEIVKSGEYKKYLDIKYLNSVANDNKNSNKSDDIKQIENQNQFSKRELQKRLTISLKNTQIKKEKQSANEINKIKKDIDENSVDENSKSKHEIIRRKRRNSGNSLQYKDENDKNEKNNEENNFNEICVKENENENEIEKNNDDVENIDEISIDEEQTEIEEKNDDDILENIDEIAKNKSPINLNEENTENTEKCESEKLFEKEFIPSNKNVLKQNDNDKKKDSSNKHNTDEESDEFIPKRRKLNIDDIAVDNLIELEESLKSKETVTSTVNVWIEDSNLVNTEKTDSLNKSKENHTKEMITENSNSSTEKNEFELNDLNENDEITDKTESNNHFVFTHSTSAEKLNENVTETITNESNEININSDFDNIEPIELENDDSEKNFINEDQQEKFEITEIIGMELE